MDAKAQVLHYLRETTEAPDSDPNDLVAMLGTRGIGSADAEVLIAFVPIAFAHVWFAQRSVRLPPGFDADDPVSKERGQGLLSDEPIFEAAKIVAEKTMAKEGGEPLVHRVAARSAEYQCAQSLVGCVENASTLALADLRFTPTLFMRIPLDRLRVTLVERSVPERKKRWMFWRR